MRTRAFQAFLFLLLTPGCNHDAHVHNHDTVEPPATEDVQHDAELTHEVHAHVHEAAE